MTGLPSTEGHRFWIELPSGKKTFFTVTDEEVAAAEADGGQDAVDRLVRSKLAKILPARRGTEVTKKNEQG